MKKLIYKIFFFVLSLSVPLMALFLAPISYIYNPFALINNKIELLKKMKSPKIIFVSGSSYFYGLSAESVSKELDIPAINMGTFIGYGYTFMLDNIKPYINKGDIVIMTPEYTLLYMNDYNLVDKYGINQVVLNIPFKHLKYINVFKSFGKLPQAYMYAIKYKVSNLISIFQNIIIDQKIPDKKYFSYGVLKWNEDISSYGDFIKIKIYKPDPVLGGSVDFPRNINKDQIKLINNFSKYIKQKNAKVYFLFSNLVDTEYKKNQTQINSYYESLKKELDVEILTTPDQFVYPYEYYYDTINHLNTKGREIYTEKIINILNSKIKEDFKK
jgi:hypothetical protein